MSDKKYILVFDQGTTSSRAILFDVGGKIISKASQPLAMIYPREGWVEQSPEALASSVLISTVKALSRSKISLGDVSAIGITNQRETTIVWDKNTGEPVYNAIVWQCRRSAELCNQIKQTPMADKIYAKTGLFPDSYFSAIKIKWILDNVSGARERAERGELLFGTVDTYLLWKATGGSVFATDYTNASRTMLYNIHTLEWDDELCEFFGVPKCMLPQVMPSSHFYGTTDEKIYGAKIPIMALVGDQQSSLCGHGCFAPGSTKATYGTGCFLLMNTGSESVHSKNGLLTTLAATGDGKKPHYALEGSVFMGGALVQWLRDGLGLIKTAEDSEAVARSVESSGGVYLVPAFTGLGAPYWDGEARGLICGLTRGSTSAHIVRAGLEAIAYQIKDVVDAMVADTQLRLESLKVDGGATNNNFLMQFQADVLGSRVERAAILETTAYGAFWLAAKCLGLEGVVAGGDFTEFEPKMSAGERKQLLDGWKTAVQRTLSE